MTTKKQAEIIWYLNTLDTGELWGYRMGVASLMLRSEYTALEAFSAYHNLDGNMSRFKTLEYFTEWYKWQVAACFDTIYIIVNMYEEWDVYYTRKEIRTLFLEYKRIGRSPKIVALKG